MTHRLARTPTWANFAPFAHAPVKPSSRCPFSTPNELATSRATSSKLRMYSCKSGFKLAPFLWSSFNIGYEVKNLSPYLAIVVSILLISKIPTFSFKKIAIQRKLTIFLFLGIGIICISLIFYTFETLVILGLIYFFLIPLGVLSYKKNIASKNFTEDENEDIL